MLQPCLLFSKGFLFNLLASSSLLLHEFSLLFVLSLFLLILNHLLHAAIFEILLLLLNMQIVFLLFLLLLHIINLIFNFLLHCFLRYFYVLLQLFLQCPVLSLSDLLLFLFLSLSLKFLLLVVLVSLSLRENILGSLFGLFYFFPSLSKMLKKFRQLPFTLPTLKVEFYWREVSSLPLLVF